MNEWWSLMKHYMKPKSKKNYGQPSLNSIVIRTSDIRSMARFYERVIGLIRLQESKDKVTLANSKSLAPLIWLDQKEDIRRDGGNRLHHLGLKVDSESSLIQIANRLAEAKIPITGNGDNDYRTAIYCKDPDGHLLEIFWEKAPKETQTIPSRVFKEGECFEFPMQDLFTRKVRSDDFYDQDPQFAIGQLHYQITRLKEEKTTLFYHNILKCSELESLHPKSMKFANANGLICITEAYWQPDLRKTEQTILPIFFYPHLSALSQISNDLTNQGFSHEDEKGLILAKDPYGFSYYLTTKDFPLF
ncbi:hypothetical protein D3H64_02935 [Atopobacter sp. AH10]|uniref:VOC family protein n=1 Tax=Atopobacter sp. AH10 TaxID=2315861 RepID=UPI000EF1DB45|nr:VOC family protein [Atopobacter sp. AH10]RLK63718.1 hypothetical protein D3H64_02935 [Atopobacter sp. AH10]